MILPETHPNHPTDALARVDLLESFRAFNEQGGKFRVAITDVCNLDCFFCHNEGMSNPRRASAGSARLLPLAGAGRRLDTTELLAVMNAFTALGGGQLNVTGGEPLAHPDLERILVGIDKRSTRVVLNTNALLARRLLDRPLYPVLDGLLASLHTTDEAQFAAELGGRPGSAARVMENLVALRRHGYAVEVNYSLGPYNRDEFARVLDYCLEANLDLKAIALVRHDEAPAFYRGQWVDPAWLTRLLESRGARELGVRDSLGGRKTRYSLGGITVIVKNVAHGRLRTSFCGDCPHEASCGEGIYGLRVGVDALWKPCLLRSERFSSVGPVNHERQILERIHAMMGDPAEARFVGGSPV
jgi:GTP 3',8-cyclase